MTPAPKYVARRRGRPTAQELARARAFRRSLKPNGAVAWQAARQFPDGVLALAIASGDNVYELGIALELRGVHSYTAKVVADVIPLGDAANDAVLALGCVKAELPPAFRRRRLTGVRDDRYFTKVLPVLKRSLREANSSSRNCTTVPITNPSKPPFAP